MPSSVQTLAVVRHLLGELEKATAGPDEAAARWQFECSWLSLAIEEERPEEAESHLEHARALSGDGESSRNQLLIRNYEADIALVKRQFVDAAARYRDALDEPGSGHLKFDLVSSLQAGL